MAEVGGAEGVGDEGGGEADKEPAAEGGEVGGEGAGGGSEDERNDAGEPRGGVSGVTAVAGEVGDVEEGLDPLWRRERRRGGGAGAAGDGMGGGEEDSRGRG